MLRTGACQNLCYWIVTPICHSRTPSTSSRRPAPQKVTGPRRP